MAAPDPRPTVTLIGWRPVLIAALLGAGTGWLLFALPDRLGAQLAAVPPVVSRSSTQNVTSCSGVPRSSKLRCMRGR